MTSLALPAIYARPRVLPGLPLTLTATLLYIGFIALVPLSAMLFKTIDLTFAEFIEAAFSRRVMAAYQLTFSAALLAATVNLFFGVLLAWVLSRYRFPGRRLIDGLVDLPFALPTAVAGISLAALYSPDGWIGRIFERFDVQVAFTPLGVVVALIFVGLPFVVRTVQPVIEDLERDAEEAAATLGANRWQTFHRVILPGIFPSALTGFALATARAIGEYGSVIFIAGNLPFVSEIVPLLIIVKLEQYDYAGAAAIGSVMLFASFALLLAINMLQSWSRKRTVQGTQRP
jgi:sulfate transport system permease protein